MGIFQRFMNPTSNQHDPGGSVGEYSVDPGPPTHAPPPKTGSDDKPSTSDFSGWADPGGPFE